MMTNPGLTSLVFILLLSSCRVSGLIEQFLYMFNAESNTYFDLYIPNEELPYTFNLENVSVLFLIPNFDPDLPMRVGIAGVWKNDSRSAMIRNSYSQCGNYNVIDINWQAGSDTIVFPLAELNVRYAGEVIAAFLQKLQMVVGLSMSNVYLLGEGLGAGVAGEVGSRLGNVSTIVAVDPARSLFSRSLSQNDAQYVQVLYSSIILGVWSSVGGANFYINNGWTQPGCGLFDLKCVHLAAGAFYAKSVCVSPYTGCRMGKDDDCGYIMGGEPVMVYAGDFQVEIE